MSIRFFILYCLLALSAVACGGVVDEAPATRAADEIEDSSGDGLQTVKPDTPENSCAGTEVDTADGSQPSELYPKAGSDSGIAHSAPVYVGVTNLRSDGNRLVAGQGKIRDSHPIYIPLKGEPRWVVSLPGSADRVNGAVSVWTVILDPTGREPGDADASALPDGEDRAAAERALRVAAHRTLKGVTDDMRASAGTSSWPSSWS